MQVLCDYSCEPLEKPIVTFRRLEKTRFVLALEITIFPEHARDEKIRKFM